MRRLALVPIGMLLVAASCSGGSGRSVEAFCAKFQQFSRSAQSVSSPDLPANATLDQRLAAVKQAAAKAQKNIDALRKAAPDEIRADVERATKGIEELFTAIERVNDLNDPQQTQALAAKSQQINRQTSSANDRVRAYTQQHCPDLSSSTKPAATSTTR